MCRTITHWRKQTNPDVEGFRCQMKTLRSSVRLTKHLNEGGAQKKLKGNRSPRHHPIIFSWVCLQASHSSDTSKAGIKEHAATEAGASSLNWPSFRTNRLNDHRKAFLRKPEISFRITGLFPLQRGQKSAPKRRRANATASPPPVFPLPRIASLAPRS